MFGLKKSIRGEIVSGIPRKAKRVHNNLINKIKDYDSEFKPTKVYSWYVDHSSPLSGLAGIRYEDGVGQVILVDTRVTKGHLSLEEYKRFLFVNSPGSEWNIMEGKDNLNMLNFFEQLVAHEYAHLMKDDISSRINRSADEAFAFWFSEVITGFTSLFLSFGNYYAERDFNQMEKVYDGLHELYNKKGIVYALENIDKVL